MRLSDLKPCEVLGEFLKNNISEKVYVSDKPSSNLADVYVEIYQNGTLKNESTKMGLTSGYVIVSVNVKLLSTGSVNTVMENSVLSKVDIFFENNKVLLIDNYEYSLSPNGTVYQGHGLYAGYSTKAFNLEVKIHNKQ